MFVKPIAGVRVPDPDKNDILPEEGREVEAKSYWFRRIETGEVIEIDTITLTPVLTPALTPEESN